MECVVVAVLASAIVSAIVAKTIAAYHFKVIDSYVREVVDVAKKEIETAKASGENIGIGFPTIDRPYAYANDLVTKHNDVPNVHGRTE